MDRSCHDRPHDHRVDDDPALLDIEVRTGTEVVDGGGDGRLDHLVLRNRATGDGATVDAYAPRSRSNGPSPARRLNPEP